MTQFFVLQRALFFLYYLQRVLRNVKNCKLFDDRLLRKDLIINMRYKYKTR